MTVSGSMYLAQALRDYGVTHFFHVPVVVSAAVREMATLGSTVPVVTHGEKAAAYMADGYARVSQKVGVCGAQAIGGSNLAAGLRDAAMARVPVVAITGGKRLITEHRGTYQELDDMPVFEPFTKFNAIAWTPDRFPDLLATAFRSASTGAPGPTHLELAGLTGEVGIGGDVGAEVNVDPRYGAFPAHRQGAPAADVAAVLDALRKAERPVIVAGGGVQSSGARKQLVKFARRWSIPVASSLNALGLLADDDELSLGAVGEYSAEPANRAVFESDLVFFMGSRTGGLVTATFSVPARDARVIHLDIDPENLGRNFPNTLPLCGDVRTVLEQLLEAEDPRSPSESWSLRIKELKEGWLKRVEASFDPTAVPIAPQKLSQELSGVMPSDAVLVADTGHAAAWLAQNVDAHGDQTVIRAHGSLGWSLPAAIGAKAAAPDRPVICFAGDGGFYYHIAELETAVRYGLNVVVVVNDNAALSQERPLWSQRDGDGWADRPEVLSQWQMRQTDFAAVAKGFGCAGVTVKSPDQVADALRDALTADGPIVVDVKSDDGILPLPAWFPEGATGQCDFALL